MVALGVVAVLSDFPPPARAQTTADSSLAGRLATVEPSARRLTLIPTGEVDLVEVFVAEDGEVRQGDRLISLADLVVHVGSRVSVHYRLDANRRLAVRIIVELD